MRADAHPYPKLAPLARPAQAGTGWPVALARVAVGAAGGAAEYFTAPPHGLWPLGLVSPLLLVLAVRGARARVGALVGLGYGAALFLPLLTWLRPVGADAWLLLAATQAVWMAALGAALAVTANLPGWPLWTACVWVAQEWARGRVPFGGFTWGRLAFGQTHSPLTAYASLGGAPLLTFAVALAGGLAGYALLRARRGHRWTALAAAAGVAAVATLGLAVPLPTGGQADGNGPAYATVAAVQGNVPRLGLAATAQGAAVLINHLAETQGLAEEVAAGRLGRPDLVVWPENADAFDPTRTPAVATALTRAVDSVRAPILVGALLQAPHRHVYNAGLVWTAAGPTARYAKRHLVPFGEYIPFRSLIGGWVGRFSLIPEDFAPGHWSGMLLAGAVRVADVICFEVTFDGPVRDGVNAGGRLIVVQTNDATYEHAGQAWDTGESAQQLAIARLRAVEHGRAVVVASTSGVSALVAPDGRLVAHTRLFTPALLEARLPLRDSRTLADRLGPLPEYLLAGIGLAALVFAVAAAVNGRRP